MATLATGFWSRISIKETFERDIWSALLCGGSQFFRNEGVLLLFMESQRGFGVSSVGASHGGWHSLASVGIRRIVCFILNVYLHVGLHVGV